MSYLAAKVLVAFRRSQTSLFFFRDEPCDVGMDRLRRILGPAGIEAKRTAVRRPFFYIEKLQPMSREDLHCGEHGKVRKVLVINGVKFVVLHQPQQMREFQG